MTKEHPEGFRKPNYTQIPNRLFDELLPLMGAAELKVTLAICRKTFGWHKKRDRISISQLEKLTGLSHQGVITGLQQGMNRGTIVRQPANGGSYFYSLVINEPGNSASQRNRLPNNLTSQRSRLEVVNEVDTQKKLLKKQEGGGAPFSFFIAWCRALAIDPKTVPKSEKHRELRYGKELAEAGWTPEQVEACTRELKGQEFWRDKPLSLATVVKEINQWHQRQGNKRAIRM